MKVIFKIVATLAIAGMCGFSHAQKPIKIAHIDSQALMQSMPESDSAQVKLQKLQKELEEELEGLQVELNRKYDEFQKNNANWTELVKNSRQQEIVTMQQRTQQFQESAYETLQQENANLLQPIREKALKAIEAVAKEQGITYVLESQVALFKAADSQDLLPLVKQRLGITK
ncbi:MAG: OmpH family outer membrane protein [Bacteroidales bacterium]|jgi:outer membrane protein|nr:OmpH family outer membrane protein [Bacteroidales bacterium]